MSDNSTAKTGEGVLCAMRSDSSPPPGWPDGKPLALSVSVMLEGWTDDSAPGIGPMGNPLKAGVLDLQARSWAEYGPKVGAWRLLDILQRLDVRCVFYVSGILAERYPELMKAIAGARPRGRGARLGPEHHPVLPDRRGGSARSAALREGDRAAHRAAAAGLAQPALHAERAHVGAAGEIRLRLARRLLRFRPALPPRHAGRRDHRGAVHHGGERHAALRALRRRAGGLHPHPSSASSATGRGSACRAAASTSPSMPMSSAGRSARSSS